MNSSPQVALPPLPPTPTSPPPPSARDGRAAVYRGLGWLGTAAACGGLWWGIAGTPGQGKPTPAKPTAAAQTKPIHEEDLDTVRLTEAAERRLGVRLAAVELKAVPRVRIYGGEATVPAGRTILSAAPLGGLLQAPAAGLPEAGSPVKKGQVVLLLIPLLSPEAGTNLAAARADAAGQVRNAETQVEAMGLALERAQRLFREGAGSKRNVEEAQAQADLAGRALEAVRSRLAILAKASGDAEAGRTEPLPLEAPETGILRNLSALPGQNVPAGAPLFEVVDLSRIWVRVPVPVGDLGDLQPSAAVRVGNLNLQPGEVAWAAEPVPAPPAANPLAATVDRFYALDNREPGLTPGQRVGVALPLTGTEPSLTFPWSAVVHDLHGGTWVYQETAPRTYRRRRVQVRFVADGLAVAANAPPAGSKLVAEGAVELFGAETGFSK